MGDTQRQSRVTFTIQGLDDEGESSEVYVAIGPYMKAFLLSTETRLWLTIRYASNSSSEVVHIGAGSMGQKGQRAGGGLHGKVARFQASPVLAIASMSDSQFVSSDEFVSIAALD